MNIRWHRILLIVAFAFQGCKSTVNSAAETTDLTGTSSSRADDFSAQVEICRVPDPQMPSSAFNLFKSEPDQNGDFYVQYSCKQTCADWQQCQVPAYAGDGQDIMMQARNPDQAKAAIAFVIDNMAGHLVLTPDGDKTVLMHAGAGGTIYQFAHPALELEQRLPLRTVMVRWEKGYSSRLFQPPFPAPVDWGWYSRSSLKATNIYELNKRVAGIISWVHENLTDDSAFATAACSMGSNATFMPVLWHGLDSIIDYQLFVGGPNMWDLNTHCDRRNYRRGHCDFDAVTDCSADSQCAALSKGSKCRIPGSYKHFGVVYEGLANHIHRTKACDYSLGDDAQAYPPFDDSSIAFRSPADWDFDHRIDLMTNLNRRMGDYGRPGGDEYFSVGEFTQIFSRITPAKNKKWHVLPNSGHCEAWSSGAAVNLLVERLSEL